MFLLGSYEDTTALLVGMSRALPGLGEKAVVPVDVVGVEAEVALLHILLDGSLDLVLQIPNTTAQ